MIAHGVAADDSCARMHTFTAHMALDGLRGVYNALNVFFGIVGFFQVGVCFERSIDGDAQLAADKFADAVTHGIGVVQNTCSIAHSVLRLQLAERDNARNMIFAVEFANMLDNVLTMLIVEVDVDIGHLNTFGVEEAFEHQAVLDRVEVSDTHSVRAKRSCCRTTTGTYADAIFTSPADILLNDKEVSGEALLNDDVGFVFVLFQNRLFLASVVGNNDIAPIGPIATLEALLDLFAEEHFFGIAFGQRKTREDFVSFQFHIALFGEQNCVVARLREVFQRLAHLFFSLHVELVVRELEALFLSDRGVGADAEHNVLRHCVFLRKVMEVVGGNSLQA